MRPLGLAILLMISTVALGFPFAIPARLWVFPWVPSSAQHAFVTVADTWSGTLSAVGATFDHVDVSIVGNQISLFGTLKAVPSAPNLLAATAVDLGVLPEGRYVVHYSAHGEEGTDSSHDASLSFSVSKTGLVDAIEYFNAALGHYFVTAYPAEIAKLDSGAIAGWQHTGESFKVIAAEATPTSLPQVCRYYGLPSAGLDSHFFSASAFECAQIAQRWPDQWVLETDTAFGVVTDGTIVYGFGYDPLASDGCPNGSRPLYRLYNGRSDVNHRYTVSKAVRDEMLAQGWILEGSARLSAYPAGQLIDTVAMCVPN